CAGASSFRRRARLERLLAEVGAHVEALRARLDDPAQSAGLSARQRAAKARAARERQARVAAAIKALPALEARQAAAADKSRRDPAKRGTEYDPRPTDTPAVAAWRARMRSDAGRAARVQRGATVETVNADLKAHRNLGPRLLVRGLAKARCVALWAALAYNVMH